MSRWSHVDIFISHKPPTRYPKFPYHGLVTIDTRPSYVIGRSMTEVHRISTNWVDRIHTMVDEVWVPASASLPAFIDGSFRLLPLCRPFPVLSHAASLIDEHYDRFDYNQ
jgi:hypothetical protein